jgi:aspartyl aminopeptidase
MEISAHSRDRAQDLLAFIDASPSPWHAVQTMAERLRGGGFTALHEDARWQLAAGGRHFVIRGGSSLIAFVVGQEAPAVSGFRLVGAHTDSPGLRVKPKPALAGDGLRRLAVEVYGGPILATFADRDLGLAGRVGVRDGDGVALRLVRFAGPLLRLPNLAIHMNREVNDKGLKFDRQTELPLLLGGAAADEDAEAGFRALLAAATGVETGDVLSWELNVFDAQSGAFWGADREFIASRQIDNLASCHAGMSALLEAGLAATTNVCAFFDHEEVGSESAAGAGGNFVVDLLQRISASLAGDGEAHCCALAKSFFISADMAHAWHPNFPAAYEPGHRVAVNAGPVIKTNASQRYSTGADGAARFILLCEKAGVPHQHYAHRADLGCGSTIGPLVAARLGVASVDVGTPMWAMHSARESAGVLDQGYLIAALAAAFEA